MEGLPSTTSRTLRIIVSGAFLAFAWILLSIVLGLGAGHAHADEADDRGGLLSGLTNGVTSTTGALVTGVIDVVSGTAASATDVVADVADTSATAVVPVVEQVTEMAPALPVAPIVGTVGSVTTAVSEVAAGGVVAPIVGATVDVVSSVPVVGTVASALTLDEAVSTLGTSVDSTLQGTTSALSGLLAGVATVAPDAGVSVPSIPLIPGTAFDTLSSAGVAVLTSTDAVATPRSVSSSFFAARALPDASWQTAASVVIAAAGAAAGGAWDGALMVFGSFAPADSALSGPGGAGPAAWVLVAFGLVIAYRAWMRRHGLGNDTAPAAPALSTDVSPD